MARRLPPLTGLRAFEAAARHLSFTRAAAELHVTQTAISHQIKALEARLGVRLFRRLPRGLVLTEEAQLFLPPIRDAFDQIAMATERLTREQAGGVLTVSVLPSFAAKWLVPRLGRLRQVQPEIELRISASIQVVDFARDDVDAAIRHGRGVYPGLRSERLLGETMFPVCSPRLLEGDHPLCTPADLRHHVLMHDDDSAGVFWTDPRRAWREWLRLAGGDEALAERGPIFDDAALLLQAAAEGQGIALGRSALVADDLAGGRLVQPFDMSLPYDLAYWLVCPEHAAERPKIRAFRDWLREEARATGEPAAS